MRASDFVRLSIFSLLISLPLVSRGVPVSSVSVAHEGHADFRTVQEAIDHAPATGETIHIAPGTYREKIHIGTPNVALVGTGKQAEDVVLSWDDAAINSGGTSKSGTVTVDADGFQAENLNASLEGIAVRQSECVMLYGKPY